MAGTLGEVVVETGGGDGGPDPVPVPAVPDAAKTLAVGTAVAMGGVLGLAYVVLRYGGYDEAEDRARR